MERHLAAILSADVAGYSRLVEDDDVATIRTLKRYREVMRAEIGAHQGRVVDAPGDNVLAEFPSVIEAVHAAVEIQRALRQENKDIEAHRRMLFRMGISVGDVVVEDDQLFGDGVNIAARVESLADPGGICLSSSAYEQCENKVDLEFEFLGEQSIKNISKAVPVWRAILDDSEPRTARPPTSGNGSQTGSSTPVRRLLMAVGLAALVGFATFHALRGPSTQVGDIDSGETVSVSERPAIIVLPFENLSDDREQAYFSNGITEDITTDLSKLDTIFVVPSAAANQYRGKSADPSKLREEFGIRYLLEGSVRKTSDQIRVNARLIDVINDKHLWSERYDRPLSEIFALQDDIRTKILTALRVNLTLEEQDRFSRAPTVNLEAYDYFLRAQEMSRRARTELRPELMDEAAALYRKAIGLDTEYAAAYAGLGTNFWLTWFYGWTEDADATLKASVEQFKKSLALDDSNPHLMKYKIRVNLIENNYDLALADTKEYVTKLPHDPNAHSTRAIVQLYLGQYQQALKSIERAVSLFPRLPPWQSWILGMAYHFANRNDEALDALRQGVTRAPNHLYNHVVLTILYSDLGHRDAAEVQAGEILRISPGYQAETLRRMLPFENEDLVEKYVASLRKAGIP